MKRKNINLILNFTQLFENFAVVNSALISKELIEAGQNPNVLGIGERFEKQSGFREWSLGSPTYIEESYELLVVEIDSNLDSEDQFDAIQTLAKFDLEKPLILLVPENRKLGVKKAFSPFGLLASSYRVDFEDSAERFLIFSNWELSE